MIDTPSKRLANTQVILDAIKDSKIKAFAFDVDGVMTNGGVFANSEGDLLRTYNAKDGFGLRMATMNDYIVAIVTGGRSVSIKKRFLSCGVSAEDIYLNSRDKVQDLYDFCKRHNLKPSEVVFVGDDLPDIPAMKACGLAACPCDAVEEVKEAANFISAIAGGRGAVRDIIQTVMRIQGDWTFNVDTYTNTMSDLVGDARGGE